MQIEIRDTSEATIETQCISNIEYEEVLKLKWMSETLWQRTVMCTMDLGRKMAQRYTLG